jgi:hypothetical protein
MASSITRKLLVAAVTAIVVSATAWSATAGGRSDLDAAKHATRQYRHSTATAEAGGYGLFKDVLGIACIDMPGIGGMGFHYANGNLVGDTVLDPTTPEALVYAPKRKGGVKLAALEYIVFQDAWDAGHSSPPRLFGQEFNFTPAPNRFGIPAYYSLHAWVWKHNPAGKFAPWNPRVSCAPADDKKGARG